LSKYRSASVDARNAPSVVDASPRPAQAWLRFWFAPVDPVGLHALRVLAGLLFLCWLLPFAGQLEAFFGLQGWFDKQAYFDAARLPEGSPLPITWSFLYVCGRNATALTVVYWTSLAVLVLFTLGICTRVTAVLTWVIVVSFTASPATLYDGDMLLVMLAFYLMIGYLFLGLRYRNQSAFEKLFGWRDNWLLRRSDEARSSVTANVALRLLQVHFAIVMLISGLHKLQFGEWWSGAAFWYPLHPPFATSFEQAREHASNATTYLTLLSLGAYATLAWQIAFPVFAWRPRWRFLLLGGAVLGWVGLTFMYELPLFGPAICICCLGYLIPGEWEWARNLFASVPGLGILRHRPAEEQVEPSRDTLKKQDSSSFVASRQR
jgi:hypothetical protein